MAIKEERADNYDARLTMRSALRDVPVKCSGVWGLGSRDGFLEAVESAVSVFNRLVLDFDYLLVPFFLHNNILSTPCCHKGLEKGHMRGGILYNESIESSVTKDCQRTSSSLGV